MKTVLLSLSLITTFLAFSGEGQAQAAPLEVEKQNVFLFCPHEKYSAISLYANVDKNDPKTIVSLGLEELAGKNSKSNTYNGVLKSQDDPNTERTTISSLSAKEFQTGRLFVEKNNLLSIYVSNNTADSLTLTIDARVSSDGHFIVGGPEQGRRDISLKFDAETKKWKIVANTLLTTTGNNVANQCPCLTGICFRAGTTCIDRICAVNSNGNSFIIMDR